MKGSGTCPKCRGARIGHFDYVADDPDGTTHHRVLGSKYQGWIKGYVEAEVEAYVCSDCGYFEEYVKRPQNVPWEAFQPFKWHR